MGTDLSVQEFEQLYRATAPLLFGFLRRRGVADAEDLVAETFTIAWRSRSRLTEPEHRKAWLFGTARRLLLADFRQRGHEHELGELLARHPEAISDTADQQRRRTVLEALARLRDEDRELILLIEWERLTPSETAQVLGITPGAARVRLHRARQCLAADRELQALFEVTA